jgi:hypothetical protein
VAHLNEFVDRLAIALYPGAYFVEFITWMKYLPSWMATWKHDALEWYKKDSAVLLRLYDNVFQRLVSSCFGQVPEILRCQENGDQRPSISLSLAQNSGKYGLNAKESAWITGALYATGHESVSIVP